MLFIKIIVQILLDLVKAIPLFCLVALVQQIAFPTDWVVTFVTFLLSFVVIASLYGLGFLFASFSFVFTKISSITSLLAYGILFFGWFSGTIEPFDCYFNSFLAFSSLGEFYPANQVGSFFYYYWDTV